MTKHGNIVLVRDANGKSLRLTKPNPEPPPATLTEYENTDPPAWMWEAVVGNAGRPCTVTLDENGAPTKIAVG